MPLYHFLYILMLMKFIPFSGSSIFDNLFHKTTKPTPESFKKTLHRIGKEILKDDNFGELLCHRNASPIIQTTLLTLKENDLKLCSKICFLVVEKSRLLEWKTNHEVDTVSSSARYLWCFSSDIVSYTITFEKRGTINITLTSCHSKDPSKAVMPPSQ